MPRKRVFRNHLGPIGIITAAAAGALGFAGCSSDGTEGACVSTEQYFAEQVWAPIMSQKCTPCHNPQGLAKSSKMVLKNSAEAGYLAANLAIVKSVASFEQNGTSLLLLKPSQQIAHEGGQVIAKGSAEYVALEGLVERMKSADECETDTTSFYAGVAMVTPNELLRKASLSIAARLPTTEEEIAVQNGGDAALDGILEKLMTEEPFYTRLKEIYNDLFLTDRYARNEDALQLLPDQEYYQPFWYDSVTGDDLVQYYGATSGEDLHNKLARWTNTGVAREPLELITHVVRENRPFTEILTANYIMVNPFSAKAYTVGDATFQNDANPLEFAEGHITGIPHAGVLTSPMWLNRFPTTDTNRNRHRSRMVFNFFLGTDILKTGQQPIDPTKITDINPTLNNAECTVCHANIDPIAGAFHNFDTQGVYTANPDFDMSPWYTDMRLPGFGSETIPTEELPNALGWLGSRIAADPRFPIAVVYTMYTGFTGQKPLVSPTDPSDPNFKIQFKAYLAQYSYFDKIAKQFVASSFNLRTVVKGIIMSPYFRAKNSLPIAGPRITELADLSTAHFLSPEQLSRKVQAVMGYPWKYELDDADPLLSTNQYRLLYGGIDSDSVTVRVTDPNGVMANIADRLGNEMACFAVPRDFYKPAAERLLFPKVETSFEPKDGNGFTVEPAVKGIKENIVLLHKRILGETLSVDDPEVERTYQLFVQTWEEGKAGMKLAEDDPNYIPSWLPYQCQVRGDFWTGQPYSEDEEQPPIGAGALQTDDTYVIRAWMAVTTYLLTDYAFLYE